MTIKNMFRLRDSSGTRRNAWLLAAMAALVGLVVFLNRPTKDNIPWFTDFDKARAAAETQNKPILLYFTASWCPPCQQMARSTWPNKRVETIITQSFVPVKVDVSNEGQKPPNRLSVQYDALALPTLILADRYGNPLEFLEGAVSANELILLLKKVLRTNRNAQSMLPQTTSLTRLSLDIR